MSTESVAAARKGCGGFVTSRIDSRASSGERIACWAIWGIAFPLGCLISACSDAGNRTIQDPRHDAYVWQRKWTPATVDAARGADPSIRRLMVLAAEFGGRHQAPNEMVRIAVPWADLGERELGIVVRLHRPDQAFGDGDPKPLAALIGRTTSKMISEAGASRIQECQMDFDCPSRLLSVFAVLMRNLRSQGMGIQWTFTALPDWLGRPGFTELAHGADGFVLQVHSLRLPKLGACVVPLCTEPESRQWITRASKVGVPFRVALPTYFSRVFFDPSGQIVDVVSEEPESSAAQRASAVALAISEVDTLLSLRAQLWRDPPQHFDGICWFRLPTAADRWVFPAKAFGQLLRGQRPVGEIRLQAVGRPEGFSEIHAENTGDIPMVPPRRVSLNWEPSRRMVAADGVAETRILRSGTGATAEWRERSWPTLIWPGERRVLGWVRLDPPADAAIQCMAVHE